MGTFSAPPLPSWRERIVAWFTDSSNVLSLVAFVISICAAVFTFWQSSVAQQTYNLSTGKIRAQVAQEGMIPSMEEVPPKFIGKLSETSDLGGIFMQSIDDLIVLNPKLRVKNSGDERIESIRVETRFVSGVINTIGLPADKQNTKSPWSLKEVEVEEYPISQHFKRGQTANLSFVRGILAQLAQSQNEQLKEQRHLGKFEIRCYGKLVGSPTYDPASGEPISLSFIWLPTGFPKEKCKEIIDGMKPAVFIDEDK